MLFILKALDDFLKYFNSWIGEFVVSFFDVTNRLYGFISYFGSYWYKTQYKVSNFAKDMPEVSQNRPKYANCITLNAECFPKKVNKKIEKNWKIFVKLLLVKMRSQEIPVWLQDSAERGPITKKFIPESIDSWIK